MNKKIIFAYKQLNQMNREGIPVNDESIGPFVSSTNTTTIENTHPLKSRVRDIRLQQFNRGYLLHVGCHDFAFTLKDELIDTLIKYINDPDETEKMWFEGKLFPEQKK